MAGGLFVPSGQQIVEPGTGHPTQVMAIWMQQLQHALVTINLILTVQGAASGGVGLLWASSGGEGDGGEMGPPGPQGPQGVGATGPPGTSIIGPEGEPGEDAWSIPGGQGPQGNTGVTGPPGGVTVGIEGDPGEDPLPIPGPQGPQGNTGGDWFRIEEQSPSGTGTITFSSLGSYTHLKILYSARSTETATATAVNGTFNGDTGSNYDRQWIQGAGAGNNEAESLGKTSIEQIIVVSGASATAGLVGAGEITLLDYRGTTFHKQGIATLVVKESNATAKTTVRTVGWAWRSTAAMTSITLALTSGNYVAGSKFTLYGMT